MYVSTVALFRTKKSPLPSNSSDSDDLTCPRAIAQPLILMRARKLLIYD
jgi:hypothetical protein